MIEPTGVPTRLYRYLATALCALIAVAAPALAQDQAPPADPSVMSVTAEATFMRAAPNVRAAVVVRLERGARVEVLDRSDGEWWRVRAGDPPRDGYVHRLVLGPPRATPVQPMRRAPMPPPRTPVEEPVAPASSETGTAAAALGPGVLASAGVGLFFPTARDTFDAVGITGAPLTYTGTVEVVRVFHSLFVRGAVDWVSETGERVFLTEAGERFPLGIPLEVDLLPIEISAGWRFEPRHRRRPRSPVVPYVGGGAGLLRYRERDPFAEGDEQIDERFASYHALAGADVFLHRSVGVRVEYRFRHVPDALGDGGVSAITGDTSLGGSMFFVGVVLGR